MKERILTDNHHRHSKILSVYMEAQAHLSRILCKRCEFLQKPVRFINSNLVHYLHQGSDVLPSPYHFYAKNNASIWLKISAEVSPFRGKLFNTGHGLGALLQERVAELTQQEQPGSWHSCRESANCAPQTSLPHEEACIVPVCF